MLTSGDSHTVAALFEESGQRLAQDDPEGEGGDVVLGARVPLGVYYVRVHAYWDSSTDNYTIRESRETAVVQAPKDELG